MPRRPETWVLLYNLMMKHRGISHSSAILGSDSNNRKDNSLWVTPFIPRETPDVKHAIAGYLRLPRPTSAPALMRRNQGTPLEIRHWKSARRLWPDTRRLQLPLDDCCRLVLSYNAVHSIQQTEQIPNDPPQMGAKSTTTSNHPSTPTCICRAQNCIRPMFTAAYVHSRPQRVIR